MDDLLPALATALVGLAGILTKKLWEAREQRKHPIDINSSTVAPKPGINGWTVFATLIVTNLQKEIDIQRESYKAKIVEQDIRIDHMVDEREEKDETIESLKKEVEEQRAYIRALREDK